MRIVFQGAWPEDEEGQHQAHISATQELVKTVLPLVWLNPEPRHFKACKYILDFIHRYPERMKEFDKDRYKDHETHASRVFTEMYKDLNAVTEGDFENVCKYTDEFPLMLGTARALYDRVGTEIRTKHGTAQDQV